MVDWQGIEEMTFSMCVAASVFHGTNDRADRVVSEQVPSEGVLFLLNTTDIQ